MKSVATDVFKGSLMEKRNVTDLDLVTVIGIYITDMLGKLSYSNYINNPIIIDAKDKKTDVQRLLINRYFLNKLLMFRSCNDVDVSDMIVLLANDGEIKLWVRYMEKYILPFCKKNNII